jgi:hypothetical protein
MATRTGSRLDVSRLWFVLVVVLVLESGHAEGWSIGVREYCAKSDSSQYSITPSLRSPGFEDEDDDEDEDEAPCDHPAIMPSANRGKTGKSALLGSGRASVAFRPPVASSQSAI